MNPARNPGDPPACDSSPAESESPPPGRNAPHPLSVIRCSLGYAGRPLLQFHRFGVQPAPNRDDSIRTEREIYGRGYRVVATLNRLTDAIP